MPHSVTIPFYAFKLHFISGGNVYIPLHKRESARVKQSIQKISNEYAKEFQKYVLDKGKYEKILQEWQDGDFLKSQLSISFSAAKNGFSYPSFDLEFEFFYKKSARGFWSIIPSLGVETFVEEAGFLEQALRAAVYQDFRKNKRFSEVQGIVAAIWYDAIELLQNEVSLKFHTPAELQAIEDHQKEDWLPQVATPLKITDPVTYGRKEEMTRFIRAMQGNFGRNILLVGASGVGKTALVWELVRRSKQYNFRGQIWETTASVLIKELTRDTGWQDNISHVVKELTIKGDILFVRNLLELFEVGKYEGNSVSIAEYLLTYISRGEVNIISECTEEEKSIIELRSPNFLSNFQIIPLVEPQTDLEEIILKKVNDLAVKNTLKIDGESIKETIRLNKRFTPYSGFPGKPIRFLEGILLNKIDVTASQKTKPPITRSEVIQHFCEEAGMPTFMVDPEIPMYPNDIKSQFNNAVFGQENAVEGVVNMLSSVKTGLSKIGKPIASFLFVGPTGVGKTELAKVLSEFMFGSRNKMIRFDMSEYSGYDAVAKLLGRSFHSDGLLTSTVRREPFCVLLFDEIEKAHPNFFDLLLQLLSEGRLTDSRGKLVNFCSTIIIMTSNIGAAAMQRRTIGPENKNQNQEMTARYMKAVQDYFKPEIYNRIDQVIPFNPLSKEVVRFVVEREVELLQKREGIRYRRMDLEIEDTVLDYLSEVGYDKRYGARYLQRALREQLLIPLARQLNLFDMDDQLVVHITMDKNKIKIDADADPLGIDLLFEEIEKNDYADLSGDYRRTIQGFKDGYLFTQLVSDLDILNREKEQLKEKFWEKKSRAKKYGDLVNYNEAVNHHISLIQEMETDYSLACMGLKAYKPDWSEGLEQWKTDFFQLKIKALQLNNPKYKTGYLRIFGKELQPIMEFYLELFKRKQFDFLIKTIWYRKEIYESKPQIKSSDSKVISQLDKAYLLRDWEDRSEMNFSPAEKGDQLCGIEFQLTGDCPTLFLQDEKGKHRWKLSEEEDHTYVVEVADLNSKIPDGIHKKSFMDAQNIFRIVRPTFLEDRKMGLNREVPKGNYWDLILPILNEKFKTAVDLAVV